MKEWFSAAEIAALKLPGLPTSKVAIWRQSQREAWPSRDRAASGGGREYPLSALPKAAREEYARREVASLDALMAVGRPDAVTLPSTRPPASELTPSAAENRDARLAILATVDTFAQGAGLPLAKADALWCVAYNAGEVPVVEWIQKAVRTVTPRTLYRWRAARRDGATERLAIDKAAARKGKGLLETANDGAVQLFILGWLAASPHLSAKTIRGYVEEEFGADLVDGSGELKPVPPPRTFQHVLAKLREEKKVVLTKETNPDKYRSNMKLRGTGAYGWVKEPNGLWMIDASPVDALCVDGRWTLYAAIDIATRRLIITLSRTPRASAVCLMLRKALLAWGVPARIKTDNGSDFAAAETQRLLLALGIDPDPSDAYCPDQKGHVERVIGTFQREVGPQLPGFIGHSVADRKAIEERKSFAERLGCDDAKTFAVSLTAAQLQQHIDDWLTYVYARREHGTLKLSPDAAAAASTATIARVDERALDVLLMRAPDNNGRRRMTAKGIRVGHHHYISHSIMVGTDVFVRLDPLDMGKIYAFDLDDGRYLGTAICAALDGVNPAAFVRAEKAQYEQMVNADVQRIRAEKKRILKGKSGIERTIALAKRKAAEEAGAAANVIAMPKREVAHETPAIRAALDVTRTPEAVPLPPRAAEILAAAQAEPPVPVDARPQNVRPLRQQMTRQQLFRRALDLEAQLARGEEISTADAVWLGGYSAGSDYRAMRALYEDGGEQVLR